MKENRGGRMIHDSAVVNPLARQLPHVRLSDCAVLILGWITPNDIVIFSAEMRLVAWDAHTAHDDFLPSSLTRRTRT